MVKGVSQRVVVVRPDESGLFEQAIFVVRDYSVPRRDAVREACRIGLDGSPPQDVAVLEIGDCVCSRRAGGKRGLGRGLPAHVNPAKMGGFPQRILCTNPIDF